MQYSLDKISTVQACDDLLALAQRKNRTLDRKRRNLGESIRTLNKRIEYLNKESAEVRASLAALTPAYHAMPEGKDKATIHVMIKRLELRLAKLEKQANTYNVASLLVKQMKYNALDSQVSAMDNYIDTLEHVRAALSQPAMHISRADDLSQMPVASQSVQDTPALLHAATRLLEGRYEVDPQKQGTEYIFTPSLAANT